MSKDSPRGGRRVAPKRSRSRRPRQDSTARPERTPRTPRPPRAPRPPRPPAPEASGGARARVLAVVLVALTAGALLLTGTTNEPAGRAPVAEQSTLSPRSLSCTGDLPRTQALAGTVGTSAGLTVDGKQPGPKPVPVGNAPVRVEAPARTAPAAYAVESASQGSWLAAQPCPDARAEWWFAGAGASGVHDSTLTLDNPRDGDAVVDIDVLGPKGPVQAPGLHGLAVAGGDTMQLDLRKMAPAVGDLAVHITATRGLVAASLAEHWAPDFATKAVQSWVAAQPAADTHLTLTGLPDNPANATLLVANPSTTEAVVKVELVGEHGTFAPTKNPELTVPPGGVTPVKLDASLRARPVAVRLAAQVPIAASVRSVAGGDESYATAVAPLVGSSVVGVPDGVKARLRLVSAGEAGSATLASYAADGHQLGVSQVKVGAGGATTVEVPAKARAVRLQLDTGRALAGSLVLSGKGVAALPMDPTGQESKIPAVVAAF